MIISTVGCLIIVVCVCVLFCLFVCFFVVFFLGGDGCLHHSPMYIFPGWYINCCVGSVVSLINVRTAFFVLSVRFLE